MHIIDEIVRIMLKIPTYVKLFDMMYKYSGSKRMKIILNWSSIKKITFSFESFGDCVIVIVFSFVINKAGIIPMIEIIVKYIRFIFLIARYDDISDDK